MHRENLRVFIVFHVRYVSTYSKLIVIYVGPLSNLRKNEMHLGKQPKLINHGNPVNAVYFVSLLSYYCHL